MKAALFSRFTNGLRSVSLAVLLFLVTVPAMAAAARDTAPLRVLIVDGVNNHDWRNTTPVLKRILEESGGFSVDVSTSPSRGAPASTWASWRPAFARYDVVLVNFNGGDHGDDVIMWPAPAERAFEDYMRDGGGFVSFHAANNAFPNWKVYGGNGWLVVALEHFRTGCHVRCSRASSRRARKPGPQPEPSAPL